MPFFINFLIGKNHFKVINILFVIFFLFGGISYADDFADAKNAYNNGQISKSINLYSKACKNKNGKACAQLGWIYDFGFKVEKDPFKSVDLYTKGCNYGNGASCGLIAQMYYQGRIVGNDDTKALGFFKKGCALNDSASCIGVTNVEDKHGIYNKKNLSKAYAIFGYNQNYDNVIKDKTISCKNGNMQVCADLGLAYIRAKDGFPEDEKKGLALLSKACNSDDLKVNYSSCLLIGVFYVGDKNNMVKGQLFLNKAAQKNDLSCNNGIADACLVAGGYYEKDVMKNGIKLIKKDTLKSNYYYQQACNLGKDDGCKKLVKGMSDDEKAASNHLISQYNTKVQEIIFQNFAPESGEEGASSTVSITLSSEGKLLDYRIKVFSGNSSLNDKVEMLKEKLRDVMFPPSPDGKDKLFEIILTAKY